MNLILTCKCGHKFRVTLERDGQDVVCPGCGRVKKVAAPLPIVPARLEEEVKLQEIDVGPPEVPKPFEEDDGSIFGIDENDGRANLFSGPGMYGTIASIRLDERAHFIAYGVNGEFALAEQRKDILIIDMKRHKVIGSYEEHDAEVTSVALSATEPLALSGDDDGELRLWDVATCKRRKKVRAHKDTINSVALSPDGRYAVTGGVDGTVRLWDLATGARKDVEHGDWAEYDQDISYVAFSRDGARFAGGSGGRVSLWETATGDRIKPSPAWVASLLRASATGAKSPRPRNHRA